MMKNVKRKLDTMLKGKEKDIYALAIMSSLYEQCGGNPALAEAVLRKDKNWDGLWKYIRDNAQKQAAGDCACIDNETVFKWARDYFLTETPPEVKIEAHSGTVEQPVRKRSTPKPRPKTTNDTTESGQLMMKF